MSTNLLIMKYGEAMGLQKKMVHIGMAIETHMRPTGKISTGSRIIQYYVPKLVKIIDEHVG
ncbi:hypothetical protein BH11PSE12_BH11PSE12_34420 [soil metagenome]